MGRFKFRLWQLLLTLIFENQANADLRFVLTENGLNHGKNAFVKPFFDFWQHGQDTSISSTVNQEEWSIQEGFQF